MPGLDDAAAGDLDPGPVEDAGPPAQESAAFVGEPVHGNGVVPVVRSLLADPLGHRRPVGSDVADVAGHTGDAARVGEQVCGAQHHLAGDTCPVGALASDQLGLDADDVEPGVGQLPCDRLAAHTHSDDPHVRLDGGLLGAHFSASVGAGRTWTPCQNATWSLILRASGDGFG